MSPRPNQIEQLCQFLRSQWSVVEADEPKDVMGRWVGGWLGPLWLAGGGASQSIVLAEAIRLRPARAPPAQRLVGHIACNQTVCVAIFDYRLTDFVLNQLRRCRLRFHIANAPGSVQETVHWVPCRVPIYLMSCPPNAHIGTHTDAQFRCLRTPYWFVFHEAKRHLPEIDILLLQTQWRSSPTPLWFR